MRISFLYSIQNITSMSEHINWIRAISGIQIGSGRNGELTRVRWHTFAFRERICREVVVSFFFILILNYQKKKLLKKGQSVSKPHHANHVIHVLDVSSIAVEYLGTCRILIGENIAVFKIVIVVAADVVDVRKVA